MRIDALIEWDDGETMEVVFETDLGAATEDDYDIFFYGEPKVATWGDVEGSNAEWIVLKVLD